MNAKIADERFFRYQARAIRRYQRRHGAHSAEEAERLALEWIRRHAGRARVTWERLTGHA